MKIINCYFNKTVILLQYKSHFDNRGLFAETYNKKTLTDLGIKSNFVQDNQSLSKYKNTFRGIHIQLKPYTQAKLIRVTRGKIIDYVVDLRLKSKSFGKFITIKMNEKDNKLLYIPAGFGHAFLTLENNTIVNYKVDKYYSKVSSKTILFNDSQINLSFNKIKTNKLILSKNDKKGISLEVFKNKYYRKI